MDLEEIADREIDFILLKRLSHFINAFQIVYKFERYYRKSPTVPDFYKAYSEYVKCKKLYGEVFGLHGLIKKQIFSSLDSPKFGINQFRVIENYLFHKKIIKEKFFDK